MKTLHYILSPINIFIWIKKRKYEFQFRKKKFSIGLHSSLHNSEIGEYNTLGDNVVLNNVQMESYSYINNNTDISNASIGKFCSIASEVIIGLGKHPTNFVSTHPAFYSTDKLFITFSDRDYYKEYEKVSIANDVWIGTRVIISGGISIGNGAIIGAGALVTKDVPPYAIVGGVPAKIIRYRFDEDTISKLETSKWWENDINWFRDNYILFHNVADFLKNLQLLNKSKS
ncbi:MAG: CatB-related O-acetyltransferase [Bacteroidota bacterium]|nr:CatB-related O-acetyltransferase [Bacteroidota bacterium]